MTWYFLGGDTYASLPSNVVAREYGCNVQRLRLSIFYASGAILWDGRLNPSAFHGQIPAKEAFFLTHSG